MSRSYSKKYQAHYTVFLAWWQKFQEKGLLEGKVLRKGRHTRWCAVYRGIQKGMRLESLRW